MSNYKARICDALLERKLQGVGAVLLEGPKWCGKTTTCERLAKSVLYMGDPVEKEKNLLLARVNINELLDGEKPRLIDEGAATLTALANSVDSEKMKKPSFRMVLMAVGDFAYTRPTDGVVVCPISALRS